jgi:hypothetical protein
MTAKQRIARRRSDMPSKYRKMYDRVASGKASPREAIKMHCLECYAFVRNETAKCNNYACPLFSYRPFQKAVKSPGGRVKGANVEKQEGQVKL